MNDLQKTIEFATNAHKYQVRKYSNLPYIVHPIQVLLRLSRWGITDEVVLAASILHDVLEDTDTDYLTLVSTFSQEIADIVLELTHNPDQSDKNTYLESFRTKSIQSLIIKIADRICNVYDFYNSDPSYAEKYFNKAAPLFIFFYARKQEINKEVFEEMEYDLTLLNQIIKGELTWNN